jgi:4-hydroxybenzoate polyprenyltransferase
MAQFFRRFIGALVLDANAFEEVESDRHAGMQSVLVVLAVCGAGGMAAIGLGLVGFAGFVTGAIVMLGGWLVWVALIATIGTVALAEPDTRSDVRELLRVLGFAAAPGVFTALAAMRPAAPVVFGVVAVWMIAAAVLGVRQALDYKSTGRAVAVCVIGWLLSFGMIAVIAMIFSRPVS